MILIIGLGIIAYPLLFPVQGALQASIGFALVAYAGAVHVIPAVRNAFMHKGLCGRDLLKPDQVVL